ncbi:MAG: peroxiredoxin [Planctomycetota bacterium]
MRSAWLVAVTVIIEPKSGSIVTGNAAPRSQAPSTMICMVSAVAVVRSARRSPCASIAIAPPQEIAGRWPRANSIGPYSLGRHGRKTAPANTSRCYYAALMTTAAVNRLFLRAPARGLASCMAVLLACFAAGCATPTPAPTPESGANAKPRSTAQPAPDPAAAPGAPDSAATTEPDAAASGGIESMGSSYRSQAELRKEREDLESARSPLIGQAAPDFALSEVTGNVLPLSAVQGQWVVLYFFVPADTPECVCHSTVFTEVLKSAVRLDAEVYAVAPLTATQLSIIRTKYGMRTRLLSDPMREAFASYHALSGQGPGDPFAEPTRATVLISPEGQIVHHWPLVIPQGHVERVSARIAELKIERGEEPAPSR